MEHINYSKEDLDSLLDFLEARGWWVVNNPKGRYGNTTLMRILKNNKQDPEMFFMEASRSSKCSDEINFLYSTPLEDVPLMINDQKLKDIVKWRLDNAV